MHDLFSCRTTSFFQEVVITLGGKGIQFRTILLSHVHSLQRSLQQSLKE